MREYKLFLSVYGRAEEIWKNYERDYRLDMKTLKMFDSIKAKTVREAVEKVKNSLSDEEIEKYYNWCFYNLKADGEIESCRCCLI